MGFWKKWEFKRILLSYIIIALRRNLFEDQSKLRSWKLHIINAIFGFLSMKELERISSL